MTAFSNEDADLTHDAFLGGMLRLWQPRSGYRAGVDPVLLAASVPAVAGQRVLELGCGVGTAILCLAARVPGADAVYDWGGGLIWLRVPEGTDLRATLGDFAGHATLVRAAPEVKARLGMFHPATPPVAAIEAGLRARFDPRGILNPGLMTPREGAA
jgi:hypothetical protein